MTTLIVQAHPVEDSFNAAVFDAVRAELARHHDSVETVRIGQSGTLSADRFESVDRLVTVYPTWYGSLPARYLAAMADLVGPWVDSGEPHATSPLRSVRSLKVVTTHGSSKLINVLQGEPGMQLWKRTVLPLCAPGATFAWKALYGIDLDKPAARSSFIDDAARFAAD